jgi:hypothetical protein
MTAWAEPLTREEQERILRTARIVNAQAARTAVGVSKRVTLRDGDRTYLAHVQTVNIRNSWLESLLHFEGRFRDSYLHNIAASELAPMLGVESVPVSVLRSFLGQDASFTWWVADVLMTEGQRRFRKIKPPDPIRWQEQMDEVRAFDALIDNPDRNYGNLLIDRSWRIWMIDHTRAFRRREKAAEAPCPTDFISRLRKLDEAAVRARLARWLEPAQLDALFKRASVMTARCGG